MNGRQKCHPGLPQENCTISDINYNLIDLVSFYKQEVTVHMTRL